MSNSTAEKARRFEFPNAALFERIVESAREGIWIIDEHGRSLYANPRMLDMLGTTADELLAARWFDFLPPEDRETAAKEFQKHTTGRGEPFQARLRRKDGRIAWTRVSSCILRDDDGRTVGLLGMFSDITEPRKTSEALHLVEEGLRLAIDAAGLGTFNCDYPLDVLYWNNTCKDHFFLPHDQVGTVELFYSRLHPDDRENTARALENAARQRTIYDVEYRTVSPDGTRTKWIRAIGRHDYDAQGKPLRIDGITIDVTDRKLLEQALREESRTTQTLYALSKTLVTEFDNNTLVQTITDAGRALTGAAFGAFFYNVINERGESYTLYTISGADRKQFERFPMPRNTAVFAATFHGVGPMRCDDITKDPRYGRNPPHAGMPEGHLPVRSYLAVPVISRFGHVIGGLFYGHPEAGRFSERDERALVGIASHAAIALDNAKMLNDARQASAAKDHFLAVLSHELRTPLNPVLLTASMMSADPQLPVDVRENAETIRRNVELEARLIDDMLDLTRISKGRIDLKQETTDVHALLKQAISTFQTELKGKELKVSLHAKAAQFHVRGDPARLQQVWWNLLRNAIKFTPPAGTVTVSTSNGPGAAGAGQAPIVVEITDTGIGFPSDQCERIFQPFQQADESISQQFGGLGLGLSICRSLVEIHNGKLTAASAGPGSGSTFRVELPTVPAPQVSADAAGGGKAAPMRSLNILLVEDHPDTARTMSRLLLAMGHRATLARSVNEALGAAGSQRFDLLLCDIGLPDGSGVDLLGQLPRDGAMHAVAITGYGMEEDVRRTREAGFRDHLTKPLNFDRLAALLQKIADAG